MMLEVNQENSLNQVAVRLIEEPPLYSDIPIKTPEDAIRVMGEWMKGLDREVVCVVNMQADLRPINMNIVSMGVLDQSMVHPREIFKSAILSNAHSMLMMHNHPSGSLEPSVEDIRITDRMEQVGMILGIPLADHVIVGRGMEYYSFREKEILKMKEPVYAQNLDAINLQADAPRKSGNANYDPQKKMDELMESLEEGMKEMFSSEKYTQYLKTMAKFHTYSLNNTILISMQRPDATLVTGYERPSVNELKILSKIFNKTVDELIGNDDMIEKRREKYFRSICRDCISTMHSLSKIGDVRSYDWSDRTTALLVLRMLYDIVRDRYISPKGNVYEKFLIKNSSEEERYEWVKFINGSSASEKEGPFKKYIDGKCEIDEAFSDIDKVLDEKSSKIYDMLEKKRESGMSKTYYRIRRNGGVLKNYEEFSEQRLNECLNNLQSIVSEQDQETFVGRWFTFYCKEIENAYMKKDKDGMDEILKDLSLLRNYIWHKSPVEENVSDDTDIKKSAE